MAGFQRDAHLAPELPDGPLDLDTEALSQVFWVSVAQLGHGGNPQRLESLGDFAADAPDVIHRPLAEIAPLLLGG